MRRAAWCLLVGVMWVSPASAEPRDEARTLALSGIRHLEEGDAEKALAALERAEALFHAPPHLLYIARAQGALGRNVDAHRTLVRLIADAPLPNEPEAFTKARRDAAIEATAIQAKVVVLELSVEGGVTVEVAGERVPPNLLEYPYAVEVGKHQVVAVAADGRREERTVTASRAGERIPVAFEFEVGSTKSPPAPVPAPSDGDLAPPGTFPVVGTALLAVGGAALVAGAVTGGLTLSEADAIKSQCVDEVCPTSLAGDTDDAKLLGNVTTGLLVGGGALVAAGVVSLFVELGGDEEEAALRVEVGPTRLRLTGHF